MTARKRVAAVAGLIALAGLGVLIYLLLNIPPTVPGPEGAQQFNFAALILFWLALMALGGGLGTVLALILHNRWPGLAGVRTKRNKPEPFVAVRQGLLLALAVGVLAVLAFWNFLDIAFVIVTFLLIGLLEASLQSRRA
jgi:hypothetical protein